MFEYILIKENRSLHQCCLNNNAQVSNALDISTLEQIGKDVILQYAQCQEYLFEKFSHPEIKKAVQYIHTHMNQPLTLETVCEAINLNKCYFCTLFKTHTQQTFTQYLNQVRIRTAKCLIKKHTLHYMKSLSTVALIHILTSTPHLRKLRVFPPLNLPDFIFLFIKKPYNDLKISHCTAFRNWARRIRTFDAGVRILCLTAWR